MPPMMTDSRTQSPSSLRADAAAWSGGVPKTNRFEAVFVSPSGQPFCFNYTAVNAPSTPRADGAPQRLPMIYDNVFHPQA